MEGFALVMCIGAVIGMSLAIWSYTKSGQKVDRRVITTQ